MYDVAKAALTINFIAFIKEQHELYVQLSKLGKSQRAKRTQKGNQEQAIRRKAEKIINKTKNGLF